MNMTENKHFLYRYRHLNGKHRERTKRILTDSVLHFANPTTFNDPFDCKVHFQSSFSVEELKWKYVDWIKKRMPDLNCKERRTKARDDIKAMKPDKFLSQITAGLQDSVDNVGVLSLSATDRNILLWSHYAAGHTGLCLKFIATKHTPFFGLALPVTYTQAYPEINVLSPPDKQIDAFLLTKAENWHYEEEWRIIDHDRGAGDKVFPAELLVGVILGARMTQKDKRTVADWAKESRSPVEILQAHPATGAFSLGIGPCEF
jgi:hypothetical protein